MILRLGILFKVMQQILGLQIIELESMKHLKQNNRNLIGFYAEFN